MVLGVLDLSVCNSITVCGEYMDVFLPYELADILNMWYIAK